MGHMEGTLLIRALSMDISARFMNEMVHSMLFMIESCPGQCCKVDIAGSVGGMSHRFCFESCWQCHCPIQFV